MDHDSEQYHQDFPARQDTFDWRIARSYYQPSTIEGRGRFIVSLSIPWTAIPDILEDLEVSLEKARNAGQVLSRSKEDGGHGRDRGGGA
jgi:hypothetical protein